MAPRIKLIVVFPLTLERFEWNEYDGAICWLQILVTHWLSVTWPRYRRNDMGQVTDTQCVTNICRQHIEMSYSFHSNRSKVSENTTIKYLHLLHYTGRTLHRYHALPRCEASDLLWHYQNRTIDNVSLWLSRKFLKIMLLQVSKDYVITLGKLFQILGVLMNNECLNSSVWADCNL